MKGLYRGRYLIVVLDENGNVEKVCDQPCDNCENKNSFKSTVSRAFNGKENRKDILFIDVFEKHDDIFSEEDEAFIEYIKKDIKKSAKDKAEELGMSERDYYRKVGIFEDRENLL